MARSRERSPPPSTPAPKRLKTLDDIPEISPRHRKQYVSPESNVVLRDPSTLDLKAGKIPRWPTSRYGRLEAYILKVLDLEPFAKDEGVPLEEVQEYIMHILLDDIARDMVAARKRAEKRIMNHVMALKAHGEPLRKWCKGKYEGELFKVRPGEIELVTPDGGQLILQRENLEEDEKDLAYLKNHLTATNWRVMHETPVKQKVKVDDITEEN